ncbi:MAG: succinyl-diaminopimelate desuccinylase [Hyphomicrobiales bacterium]|nr:succinyl-diaminopimelate desuccinylase [Hyphomicrobiales bacterium]MCY4048539.1 succinyl-diaminopimelate desuccinylase [Hyphomicrobiales bacterium]MCY4053115.1 succinyl-diaminopimelate desuccinylase [Hyphomicrobiales bacterium]
MSRPDDFESPVAIARTLIGYPSVTPDVGDALNYLENLLEVLGFTCRRLDFGEGDERVDNLYARRGKGAPHFCFAGHMDVVPAGDSSEWSVAPFEGIVRDGHLFGRGAVDMKGSIAAFVYAVAQRDAHEQGSISLLIAGDEEGPAVNGTVKVLEWLREQDEVIDDFLVGEPTCREHLGDTIKIGRRGSLNLRLRVNGVSGHAAYPELARNPVSAIARMVSALCALELDEGNENFQPSVLTCTSIDTNNPTSNVIPMQASARMNIRFNDLHTRKSLETLLRGVLDEVADMEKCAYEMDIIESGKPFLGKAERLISLLEDAINTHAQMRTTLSTGGGTSDARFIREHGRVVEFGLVGRSMHQADECVAIEDLERLGKIYGALLDGYFAEAKSA